MTAAFAVPRHPHPPGKLLQIARHRVLRWFRPSEAELRRVRLQLQPHPVPRLRPSGMNPAKETADEQRA
jgi:hypothetical protein